ncbi:MAG: SUMF1/EgtB/PvdO family nonheme iron enzyme [Nitrosomonadales bacterium]|nr:SUMF1/EgtB/PvdO family nonheme iron enzyme [Nitrosomonadales bacterium]
MVNIRAGLAVILFSICVPALAEGTNDPFQEVAAKYLAAKPKPQLSEEARKFKVQAEFMVQEKQNDKAIELYGKALEIAPWWPEGRFKLALLLGEGKKYREATVEMKRYLLLEPAGADARAAQDKLYQWELVALPVAGKEFKDCPECPEMVELPAGSFDMGSDNGEQNEKPKHRVTIAKPFAIGKTEVTQAQWKAVMQTNPSNFDTCGDDCPVEQVSWDDVQNYIQKLNAKTGRQFRLPTEAEWEYACRAGTELEFCGSNNADAVAWNSFNSGSYFFNTPHPVATKQANAFGLHDMSGNVWEWTQDTFHENYVGAPTDGSAWDGGSMRVLRGGSWGKDQKYGRAAVRHKFGTNYRDFSFGFRLAMTLQ